MDRLAFPFEIRALADSGEVEGLVSAFGGVDHYGDTVAPNAYAKSLASLAATGRKLPMLFGHDLKRPIGAWADLKETAAGLYGKGKITLACRDGAEAHALAKDGAIGGISIGFTIPDGGAVSNGRGRLLKQIDLMEASLVAVPADPLARIATVKSIRTVDDIRDLFHSTGLSGRQAKAAAGAAWKAINEQPDEDAADAELAALLAASAKRLGFS